ncbi:26S proteasome non-ATPase regulatory subunit [Capsaspora owczarzaki ATCC 30864]|uniref:26S proteasome non-ATPase regulatory subunit n=1 Tax=Capsaspora owczarzaki (strain ATCC 30864) TaxID=595528 RepID=A0A0D2WQA2_CAPO3|nr:26S proteasome non-ATPase regulatory subunit [Capsaspora owczarzaki ATCC 30864]KJE93800.1 26S proteasome non-ATPase regulatory subunit [Capsaspora owczarzaki ATCC 30864]|eukprot:XP_004347290.1 26S proteasome non-ATPase regulatory subunit [Capsaspora owczarzaki ATCC 30864]
MTTAADLTEEARRIARDKARMEADLAALLSALSSHGADMASPLVDSDGFPRNDIDVHAVRSLRNQVVVLRNDLRAIMKQAEVALQALHASKRSQGAAAAAPAPAQSAPAPSTSTLSDAMTGLTVARQVSVPADADAALLPFARVDQVAPSSPASAAGLVIGDLLLQLGSIRRHNFTNLASVGEVVRASENAPVDVLVDRHSQLLALTLTPRRWSGQGLLGCRIVPL